MLKALAFLYAEGYMYRDIKAENILASNSPLKAIIIDFGYATWERTSKDHLKGTIRYLAPKIIALKEKTAPFNTTYDVSANIWGIGLTAYELIYSSRVKFGRILRKIYNKELLPKIATSQIYSIDSPGNWASALIREMLYWDPRSRIKAE